MTTEDSAFVDGVKGKVDLTPLRPSEVKRLLGIIGGLESYVRVLEMKFVAERKQA